MYYIYHVPGIKIGCSQEVERRLEKQGYAHYEILETHEDGWIAGNREQELQKEYGYPVDRIHYMESIKHFKKATEAPKNIQSSRFSGKSHTLETKIKVSQKLKGVSKPKFECPHCKKIIGNRGNLTRHLRTH